MAFRANLRLALAIITCGFIGLAHAEDGVTPDEILIGGTTAVTGPLAATCNQVTHGQLAHFQRINKAGGIYGRKIHYEVLDDGYSAQRAISNVRRFAQQDHVFAIFGGCGTVTAAGVLSSVEKTDIPYLFPYAGLDRLIEPVKPNVFALMPLYSDQTTAAIKFAVDRSKPKTAAIFSNGAAGHEVWRKAARDALAASGVKILADEVMEITSPDRTSFVAQAKEANPDLLVLLTRLPTHPAFCSRCNGRIGSPE